MIEVVKIEDFVIEQLFLPYLPSLCPSEYAKAGERKLRRNPEYIIQLLEENWIRKKEFLIVLSVSVVLNGIAILI